MFLAIYTFLPNKKLRAKDQLIGAVFSAFTWSIVSIIFSFYVSRFAAYSIYGSMTTIALTLLWFYCLFTVLFMGALIGRFLEPATQYLRNESLLNRRKSERKEQRKGKLQ